MTKSFRSGLALHRLMEDAPIDLLLGFFAFDELPSSEDFLYADQPASDFRRRLILTSADLDEALARRLDDLASRVLALAGDGARDLEKVVSARLAADRRLIYDAQLDALGRSLWAFLGERHVFEDAESYHHAAQYRGFGKPYAAFQVTEASSEAFAWDAALGARLAERVKADLRLKDQCTVSHLTLCDKKNDLLHVVIVRHAGPLSSVAEHRSDGRQDRHYFKPPNEATLFYAPRSGVVEICADSPAVRQDIAVCFAEVAIGMNLSNKSLTFMEYDLSQLQQALRLPHVEPEGFAINRAAITEIEVRPNNPLHRLSLKVTIEDDIEPLAEHYLGAGNLLRRGAIIRAVLCVNYNRRGSTQKKTLNIVVSYPNRCNLRSNPDAEKRDLGRSLLEGWGILRKTRALGRLDERALFPVLLDLYDLRTAQMVECDLTALGFDVSQLIEFRIVETRGRHAQIFLDPEDGGPDLVEAVEGIAEMAEFTSADGRPAWAPGELVRKLEINTQYVRELILRELEGLLTRKAIVRHHECLLGLGEMDIKDSVPCYLARGLADPAVFCDLDVFLRRQDAPGVGIVFTTSRKHPKVLARNVVVSLHDFHASGFELPLASIEAIAAIYRQNRQLALGGSTVQLLSNTFGGKSLHVPGRPELALLGANQIRIVERLVDAYCDGTPVVPTAALMEGMGAGSPSQAFGKRWPAIVDVYVTKVGERGGWRLIA